MNIWSLICNALALTPEQEAHHHQLELDYGIVEPTAAERAQMEREDTRTYVKAMAPNAMRDAWFDEYGKLHWRTYVIDQNGRQHTIATDAGRAPVCERMQGPQR